MSLLKKYQLLLLSLLGGILLSAAWPERGFAPLLFVGFIPFLYIEDYISRHRENYRKFSVFWHVYPGILLWNVLTTWWVWNSTAVGSIAAFLLNALMMSATFQIYSFVRRWVPSKPAYISLIFLWISFEYFHHNWDGTWPWLSLGNGFASWHKWVQWYEYTGIFGGTLWILLVNVLFLKTLINYLNKKSSKHIIIPSAIALLLILLTVLQSYRLYRNYKEKPWPVDVIVVQPDMDPYSEQFELPFAEVLQVNLDLAQQVLDSNVDFIVSPESAIQENIWEERIHESASINTLKTWVLEHPNTGIVIGASTYHKFQEGEPLSETARKFRSSEGYYDAYNSALYFNAGDEIRIHHKSKLTPGVEKMPFAKYLKPLENMALNLGGTVGSLGVDKERTVFVRPLDSLKVAPVICYESVFGGYVTQYIRKGANLIFVITNDGWWGDTPGYRQHFTFSKLRAIETRRSIARSANTGRSAFIDQRGDVFQATDYWVPASIRQTIHANDEITIYVQYGDYIARLSAFVAVFLILIAVSYWLRRGKLGRFSGA
jgi:apolipoprotein N-acyltransferase